LFVRPAILRVGSGDRDRSGPLSEVGQ
jgi:hypothetical protein